MVDELPFGPDPIAAFDGITYEPLKDYERLSRQLRGVIDVMRDGLWHTLDEISMGLGSEAGISARLRDLRKRKYGSQNIERLRSHDGLWLYRWNRQQEEGRQ